MKENTIDSVKLMRDIRTKLSKKYYQNPALEKKELDEIRKKYDILSKNIKVKQIFISG